MLLQHLEKQAIAAHNGTSFSPEKRGATLIASLSACLENDIAQLEKMGVEAEGIARYAAKFESLTLIWLGAKSRCISSMIAGPSNFPVRRAEKANQSEHNAQQRLDEWRNRVINGVEKRLRKQKIAEAGGPLEMAKAKLKNLQDRQEFMKAVNAAYRAWKKNPATLEKSDLSAKAKEVITTWVPAYSYEKAPFQTWQLSNNNATIKNTEDRIAELSNREAFAEARVENDYTFEGGRVEVAAADDRFRIFHDAKPAPEKIALLKKNGFKWSPSNQCWQRQITANARYAVQVVTGIKL